jgi:orotidine-5'-phosphate decarboxylase
MGNCSGQVLNGYDNGRRNTMIDRLVEAIQKTKAPICVGLDPQMSFIPEEIRKKAFQEFGQTLPGAAEAIWQFNKGIIDAVCDLVPAVKPQVAMYEMYGIEGLRVFEKTVSYCQEKGLIVIGDVKRGDIGSTSAAYAAAHLGDVSVGEASFAPFHEDICTVNPYLGSDGVMPFVKECVAHGKGIFVLVKTSNPSSGEFQDRSVILEDGSSCPLYELVGKKVDEWASDPALIGESGYSEIGAVVGATYPEMGAALRRIMPKSFILVPGYGAQGGTGKDLVPFFREDGLGAIVNSSRGIIAAYKKEPYAGRFGEAGFAQAAREAVLDMKKDIEQALT